MKKLKVRLTLTEELLGTASGNKAIHDEYIASKIYDKSPLPENVEDMFQEELDALVDEQLEKTKTVFPRNKDGEPIVWDYQIRGMFKDSCKMLRKIPKTISSDKKYKAYKQQIDGLIFVEPRMIPINLSGPIGDCQRSLRASTPMGERVALANSETAPAGSTLEFTVRCYADEDIEIVKEWLNYGVDRGLGAWRNSGKGRYTYEVLEETYA